MIQPISPIRQNYNTTFKHYSFKGFYDPTCVSHIDPEAEARAYRAFLDAKAKAYESVANSPLVKVSIKDFKDKFLPGLVKDSAEDLKGKFPLRFIKNAQDLPEQGSILKHILPDGVTTVDIPLETHAIGTRLLDANNILTPNVEKYSALKDIIEGDYGNIGHLSDIADSTADAIDTVTGEISGGVVQTLMEKFLENADDISDIADTIL